MRKAFDSLMRGITQGHLTELEKTRQFIQGNAGFVEQLRIGQIIRPKMVSIMAFHPGGEG